MDKKIKSSIGDRIRAARKALGYTQQDVAVRTGMTVTAISGLENGRRKHPRIDTIARLNEALQTKLVFEESACSDDCPLSKPNRAVNLFLKSHAAEALGVTTAESAWLKKQCFFTSDFTLNQSDVVDLLHLYRKISLPK